jgi:glycosyltransferase involved in cell wall biosynthesis
MRVAFSLEGSDEQWLGGLNYLRNMIAALQMNPQFEIIPVILAGKSTNKKILESFPKAETIVNSLFDRKSPKWFIRKIIYKIFSKDIVLERFLQQHSIKVLSHSGWIGLNSKVKTIGWIPDFQHLHLQSLFDSAEHNRREKLFFNLSQFSDAVIVSSFSALKDFEAKFASFRKKVSVLHFVVLPPLGSKAEQSKSLCVHYNIPKKYFFMPNQFWEHKNHGVVVEALELLKQEGKNVEVVCTGNTVDNRNPNYFKELNEKISSLEMSDRFHILGIVPYEFLQHLLLDCVAVLNPSLFEGWSTTVEEAKSSGKQIILSDIPVHREQNPENAFYFQPRDAQILKDLLWNSWTHYEVDKDFISQCQAKDKLSSRVNDFVKAYASIVLAVVSK